MQHGVTIIGYTDLPSRLARQSSTLYATNLLRLTEDLCKARDGVIDVNMEDEVIRGTTVVKEGEVTWPPPPPRLSAAPPAAARPAAPVAAAAKKGHGHGATGQCRAGRSRSCSSSARSLSGSSARTPRPRFSRNFTVFVLGCFVGYMVIWNVTPSLHTPLMSVTNAISSIIIIGALIQIAPPLLETTPDSGGRPDELIRWLAVVGIALTSINMFGGFAVTRRMLAMFRK